MNSPIVNWRHTKKLQEYINLKGKLIAWTKIHAAPHGFEESVPYFSGIVEFENNERLPVMIVDCEEKDLKINLKVTTIIRRGAHVHDSEIINYVIKVKPL